MALSITHTFHSPVIDESTPGEVGPDEWNDAHQVTGTIDAGDVSNAGNLTKADDTNVTLTLGGTPAGALLKATSVTVGWTGTLAAARLNGNVVQAVTNDTNIQGSITAQNLTFSWAGTLANARLADMAQSTFKMRAAAAGTGAPIDGTVAQVKTALAYVASDIGGGASLTKTDDTNVTLTLGGTPTAALLAATSITVGWSGTLAVARGGTGIAAFGTGVATALGINVGSAGAFVTFNGALGTPSSVTLTNATGLPIGSGVSGLGSNVAAFLATPSSANLIAALTDETGTGANVFANTPTLVTPSVSDVTSPGTAAASWQVDRRTTAGTGRNLTIAAGGAKSGETDTAGGDLILSTGIATGELSETTTPAIILKAAPRVSPGSGTTDRTPAEIVRFINNSGGYCRINFRGAGSDYAFAGSSSDANSYFNCASGGLLDFRVNNNTVIQVTSVGLKLPSYTVATLPVAPGTGVCAFATNVRVSGEGAGVGTGGIVSHNGTAWKVAGTNVTAAA